MTDQALFIHGDARRLPIDPKSIDAIVTDPPYGIGYKSGDATNGKWKIVRHQGVKIFGDDAPFDPTCLLKIGAPMVLWGANFYSGKLPGGGWLIWDKRPGIEDMEFNRSDSEVAYISNSKKVETFRYLWHGLCRAHEIGEHYHPTQKPIALMRWCIQKLKLKPNSLIVDPYCGSGSTAIAAEQEGHRFIGLDLDREYLKIAWTRYHKPWKHVPRPGRQEHHPLFRDLEAD